MVEANVHKVHDVQLKWKTEVPIYRQNMYKKQ